MTEQARHLVERVSSLEPGIYTADSDTDGYGSLMASVSLGSAALLGEEYLKGGIKSIAVEVRDSGSSLKVRKNPEEGFEARKVKIGDDFYTRALREYDPPLLMLYRELYQNSVDAGAKHNAPRNKLTIIDTTIQDQADGTQIVSVTDNSGGMSIEILENKFLTIAETGKKGDVGGAGGFGIAKELIVFPWLSYEIHTQDVLAKGYRADYGVKKVPFLDGTRITIRLPADKKTSTADAITVIERSYLPECRFRVNGESVSANLRVEADDEVEAFDGRGHDSVKRMSLYHKPKARKHAGFFIRKVVCTPGREICGSLFMVEKSIDTQSAPGFFCLEITGSSLDTLVANRMSLLSPYSWQVEAYLRSLVKDKHAATKKKKNALHKKWVGSGKFRAKAEAAGELAAIMHQFVGASQKFDDANNLEAISRALKKNEETRAKEEEDEHNPPTGGVEGPQGGGDGPSGDSDDEDDEPTAPTKPIYTTPPDLTDVVKAIRAVQSGLPDAIDTTIKLLAHECDFYIHNEIEDFRVPKKFMPTDDAGVPTMAPKLRKLSRWWGEVCRAILISADKPFRPYGIGWMFETEFRDGEYRSTLGEYIRENGEEWLLLNPFRGGLMGEEGKLYSLRQDSDLDAMFAIAVHECAHLIYRGSGHDEGYAKTLTDLIAKSREVGEHLKTIRNIVTKRPPGWKPAVKAKAAPRFYDVIEVAIRNLMKLVKEDGGGFVTTKGGFRYRITREGSDGDKRMYAFSETDPSYAQVRVGETTVSGSPIGNTDIAKAIERAFREDLAVHRPSWVRKKVDAGDEVKEALVDIEKQLLATASEGNTPYASVDLPSGGQLTIETRSQQHNTKLPWYMTVFKDGINVWGGDIKGGVRWDKDWEAKTIKSIMRTAGPIVAEQWDK